MESDEGKILKDFLKDIDCLKALTPWTERVNVFDVLKLTRIEIRHSNMLAWLIDPNENHGLGDKVLQGLFKKVADQALVEDYYSFSVKREWRNIDIIAVSSKEKIVLCIENKIDSDEHDDQLDKYLNTIQIYYPDYKRIMFFLTPSGKQSSDPDKWKTLSYNAILQILSDAEKGTTLKPEAAMLINHYVEILRRDIVGESKENGEVEEICKEIYLKHRKALDLIFKYRQNFVDGGSDEELSEKEGYIIYQIRQGDTLRKIARENNTTVAQIMDANLSTIQDENCITVGRYIYIPQKKSF